MKMGERIASRGEWLQLLVRHLMGRRLREASEADDVVQEIVLRALQTPAAIPDDSLALDRWLRRLAKNVVIDLARHLRARGSRAPERLAHSDWSRAFSSGVILPSPDRGPLTQAGLAEDRRRLLTAYDALTPEHRRVIGLRQFQGLSGADCARRMGRSESAIHSLYRRALQAWAEAAG